MDCWECGESTSPFQSTVTSVLSQAQVGDRCLYLEFPVGAMRRRYFNKKKKPLRASKGQFSSERLSEAFPPLVLHLRSSSRILRCRKNRKQKFIEIGMIERGGSVGG